MKEQKIVREKSQLSGKQTAAQWLPNQKHNRRTLEAQNREVLITKFKLRNQKLKTKWEKRQEQIMEKMPAVRVETLKTNTWFYDRQYNFNVC